MKKVKLGEISELAIGFVGTVTTQYEENGIPFLRTLNIKPYKIDSYDLKRITRSFHESQKKSILHHGDIIMVHTGIPGFCCVIPPEYDDSNCIDAIVIRPDRTKVNPYYLEAYMNTVGYKHIERQQVGCVQKHFNLNDAVDFELFLPDLEEQNRVAELICSVNQKLFFNDNILIELEAMAKMLYDYWFTQFDFPNEEGKPYRSSGGEMVWNDQLKRAIPKRWDVGNLYAIANPINGLACQKHRPKENEKALPVVKIKEMHEGITEETELVSVNIPDKHKIFDGDILFSWSATLEVMYWFGGDAGLNQHIFKVVPVNEFSKEYVYHQFSAYVINFVKMAEARKTTMGHITTDHLAQSKIVLPPHEIVEAFSEIVAPIHQKIGQCQKENRELIKLRNWLLPMLMNGQATVK